MRDEKYIVFKREEWEKKMNALLLEVPQEIVADVRAGAIQDATVIRCQDIFAAPALSAYADAITTTLEITDLFPREANGQVRAALLKSADFFRDRAEEARGWPSKKLPD